MSFGKPDTPALPAVPGAPPPPPMFGAQASPGSKPKAKSMTPTFLGAQDSAQPGQLGAKTLIGQ